MRHTNEKAMYRAFGLNVSSEISLPELTAANHKDQSDITIEIDELSRLWSILAVPNESFIIRENFVMFEVPDTAIYAIQNGSKITVEPKAGCDEDELRLYLLGTCMGAIMMQRKILPLHGSAVVMNGKAYAFVGESGAGKSTLASAFLSKDYRLLSDDVIPVTLSPDHIPYITPAYPQQKLWLESLNELGLESSRYRPVIHRATKYAVPVPAQFASEPIPLAGVFELVKTENEQIELVPTPKLERLLTLFRHTYRNFIITPSGLMQWHFTTTASILKKIDVYRLCRPVTGFTAYELASLVIETIENEKQAHLSRGFI